MDFPGAPEIEVALQLVGELLASEARSYAICVIGGAALNLHGVVSRTTSDVDILAFASTRPSHAGDHPELIVPPEPLPEPLLRAARTVARDLDLDPDWLNSGPALQWKTGLPPGLATRVEWRQYAALAVGLVSRVDLISFKLFAAAHSSGPRSVHGSVHYQDLLALAPSSAELTTAASWVRSQDASSAFADVLLQAVIQLRHDHGER